MQKIESILEKLFPHRWSLGLLIFILVVILKLSGSSIGMWDVYVPDSSNKDDGILLGVSRPIRSDEWAVATPLTLSQYHNKFAVRSNILRGTETDVYMVVALPVWDWSIIFRPFHIGYLFLNPAQGLSFYWYGRLIALFLVSLDLGMLLTKKKKSLSLSYAFLTTLAPAVQWWFSNFLPDILVYGQGIILCFAGYVETQSYKRRIIYTLGLFLFSGAYALILYPAWQVPFFYIFLAIILWKVSSHWEKFSLSKKDGLLLAGALCSFAVCMFLIVSRRWDVINAVTHSVYPGQRMEIGGSGVRDLFRYIGNFFFPFRSQGIPLNQCEMSVFFDCFPLGIIMSAIYLWRRKQKDRLLIALLVVAGFLGCYIILGFSPWLSKLTLLSNTPAGRGIVALSFINLVVLIRSLAVFDEYEKRKKTWGVLLCFLLAGVMTYCAQKLLYGDYFSYKIFGLCVVALTVVYFSMFVGNKTFCVIVCLLSLVIGGTVNPIRRGLDVIESSKLGKTIQAYASQSTGKWLAVSDMPLIGNYLPIFGAPTINCTNTYTNRNLWNILDPDGKFEDVYNRYAHMIVKLSILGETRVELIQDDVICMTIDVHKLENLGVEYLFSDKDLTAYNTGTIVFNEIFSAPTTPYRIYRLEVGGRKNSVSGSGSE